MKTKIYYSHPMELDGKGLIDDSGKRAEQFAQLLGDKFDVWIPEKNQAKEHSTQAKIDLDALLSCNMIVVDFYHFGMLINESMILGKGTNQEVGFVKALNKIQRRKIPIVQIIRQTKKFHCFDVEGDYQNYGVKKNCSSLEEAVKFIEGWYAKK